MADRESEFEPGMPSLREVRTAREKNLERAIRDAVFIKEQGVPFELEFEKEGESNHFLLYVDGEAVGCARYRVVDDRIKLERVAVVKSARGKGYGRFIITELIKKVGPLGHEGIFLHSQTYVVGFYKKCGFKSIGGMFTEAGIPHVKMILPREA